MPTFDASTVTYTEYAQNRLGDFGIGWPVGRVVWIDGSDTVAETDSLTEDQIQNDAKAGSGDFGKAIFRRGKTYTITAGEQTLLDAAGYTTS